MLLNEYGFSGKCGFCVKKENQWMCSMDVHSHSLSQNLSASLPQSLLIFFICVFITPPLFSSSHLPWASQTTDHWLNWFVAFWVMGFLLGTPGFSQFTPQSTYQNSFQPAIDGLSAICPGHTHKQTHTKYLHLIMIIAFIAIFPLKIYIMIVWSAILFTFSLNENNGIHFSNIWDRCNNAFKFVQISITTAQKMV